MQCRETSALQSLSHRENWTAAFQHMDQNYLVEFKLRVRAIEASSISYESFLLVNNCGEVTKASKKSLQSASFHTSPTRPR